MLDIILSLCVFSLALSVVWSARAVHNLVRAQMGLQAHLNVILQQLDRIESPPFIKDAGLLQGVGTGNCSVCGKFPHAPCHVTSCPYVNP